MKTRTLEEVGDYLGERAKPDQSQSPQEQYDHIEMLAIQVLDSEFDLHPDGKLEDYLRKFLEGKRRELKLDPL